MAHRRRVQSVDREIMKLVMGGSLSAVSPVLLDRLRNMPTKRQEEAEAEFQRRKET